MMRNGWLTSALCIAFLTCAGSASAQLVPRTGRFTLDADLLSAGRVRVKPDQGGDEEKLTVIGVGSNQLGSSRAYLPVTPLGVGLGYAYDENWLVGLRLGFGYDWLSPENGPNERVLAISAVPKLTWVTGDQDIHHAKLFVDLGPLVQYNRIKAGGSEQNVLVGGFEAGVGTLRFFGPHASLDFGAYFQGRFGKWDTDDAEAPNRHDTDLRDLRGVIRLGGSLWARRNVEVRDDGYRSTDLETRAPPPAVSTPAPEPSYVAPAPSYVAPAPATPPPAPQTVPPPPAPQTVTPPPAQPPPAAPPPAAPPR